MFQILMNVYLIRVTPMQHVTILMAVLCVPVLVDMMVMAFSVPVSCSMVYCLISCLSVMIVDINECLLDTNGCDQGCINTPGSFLCNCFEGYVLNEDGYACDGECIVHK